jgi:hypothetical protein
MARFNVVTDAETGEAVSVPFTSEEEAAADALSPTPADFPLSRRQVRKAMLHAGIPLNGVDAALASLPAGEVRDLAIIDWQDAPVYLRSHPMFDMMAPIFGITPAQLDALWIWAASLDA